METVLLPIIIVFLFVPFFVTVAMEVAHNTNNTPNVFKSMLKLYGNYSTVLCLYGNYSCTVLCGVALYKGSFSPWISNSHVELTPLKFFCHHLLCVTMSTISFM